MRFQMFFEIGKHVQKSKVKFGVLTNFWDRCRTALYLKSFLVTKKAAVKTAAKILIFQCILSPDMRHDAEAVIQRNTCGGGTPGDGIAEIQRVQ